MKLSALASIIKDCGRCSQITAANGRRFISTGPCCVQHGWIPQGTEQKRAGRNAEHSREEDGGHLL